MIRRCGIIPVIMSITENGKQPLFVVKSNGSAVILKVDVGSPTLEQAIRELIVNTGYKPDREKKYCKLLIEDYIHLYYINCEESQFETDRYQLIDFQQLKDLFAGTDIEQFIENIRYKIFKYENIQ